MKRVDLVPCEGSRNLGPGTGADRPGAEDRLVRRVLVVVDEDAPAALLLPPRRRDQLWAPALELTGRGDGCRPHFVRVPTRLQADVDVEPAVARGLRVADDPKLVQQAAKLGRCGAHLVEADTRLRVEVEAQLVGDLGPAMEVRPHMKTD